MPNPKPKKLLFPKDDLEKIARFGEPSEFAFKTQNAAGLARLAMSAFELQRTFAQEFDAIAENPHLSDSGKDAARRTLAGDYLHKLECVHLGGGDGISAAYSLTEMLEIARQKRAKRQGELDAASRLSSRDSPADAIRDCYVWDLLRAVDPLERPGIFAEAITNGDGEIFAAFVRAPKLLKLLDSKVREEGVSAWNAKVNPEAAREVRELGEAEIIATSAFAQARQFIQEAAGLPGADPIQVLASGSGTDTAGA